MISIRKILYKTCLVSLISLSLAACETPTSTNQRELGELKGLPLTNKSSASLQADLDKIAAMGKGQGCTEQEIDFITVSLTAFAVGIDQPLTEPWNASEQARFDALMQRWQSLGGDARDISAACRNSLASLKLPIL